MDIKNCKRCRRIFNYIGGDQYCPSCREEVEKKFQEVRDYLIDNNGASVREVVENCEVEESQVRQWVREERLEFSSDVNTGITCEKCGVPISTGRYCNKCKVEMMNNLNGIRERVQPKIDAHVINTGTESKMRFIGRS